LFLLKVRNKMDVTAVHDSMLRQAQHHHERFSKWPFALSLSKGEGTFCYAL